MADVPSDSVETIKDIGTGDEGLFKRWLTEISLAEKDHKGWWERADKVVRRYRDERGDSGASGSDYSSSKYNIFWSNVQVLQPALYSRTPKPNVRRRFRDKDKVGRAACQVLERSTSFSIDDTDYDFDSTMKKCRDDWLIPGRGNVWVRYLPYFSGDEGAEQISFEEVVCDYVHWKDFLHNPARTWAEVRWVARKTYLTRDELVDRFGKEIGWKVNLDYTPKNLEKQSGVEDEFFKKACVYEIWDKDTKQVYWISKGYKEGALDQIDDPLGLAGFFPCPRPLLATTTSDSLIPIPDYALYQDQARELDELTSRIDVLVSVLRFVGVYDASKPEVARLVGEACENEMIPVSDWPSFMQSGGLKGVTEFVDIQTISEVIANLYQARDKVIQDLYQVTGMADIIRGSSDPRDTATAQQIKGQFATLRLADRQSEMQRFARDVIALKAEIIAEHFQPQTIALMSGVQFLAELDPNPLQLFEQAVELLRNDALRTFRIDIETDSTIAVDEGMEKQQRIELLNAAGQFLQQATNAVQNMPDIAPLMGHLMLFGLKGFKMGRDLETIFEETIQQVQQRLQQQQQQPQQPDPEIIQAQQKMQIEMAKIQQKANADSQRLQLDMEKLKAEAGIKELATMSRIEAEGQKILQEAEKIKLEREKALAELALDREKISADISLKLDEMMHKRATETLESMGVSVKKQTKVMDVEFFDDPHSGNRRAKIVSESLVPEGGDGD